MDEEILLEITGKETLHWSYRNQEELPKELETATNLEDLYLKHNNLKKLPNWIGKLVNLSLLQLHGNKLEELPDEIGSLYNLHKLDLGCNCLWTLPVTIKNLYRLHDLNLENNLLTHLPDEIGLLPELTILTISSNKLKTLPYTLGCCSNLQELHAQNNNLTKIPNNVIFLPNLSTVRLENNKLIYLPAILFYGNPLINFSNNASLNYISYDFYSYLTDVGTHRLNLVFFKNNHNSNFTCGQIKKNLEYYYSLPNIMVELNYRGQNTSLVLPETLQNISSDTSNFNHIPSLCEILLRQVYKSIKWNNNTAYFYNTNDKHLPKHIKNIFINGPTAKCHNCKNFIFTECILWVVPKILYCSICLEADILTVVYFCSTSCVNIFQTEEDTKDDWLQKKLSTLKLKWTRIK